MAELPKGLDPRETNGTSGDTSKRGLYVFEAKDELGNKTGEPKFLEANDPAQADAFVHQGWRRASEQEAHDYVKQVEAARKAYSDSLKADGGLADTLGETRTSVLSDLEQTALESKQAVYGTETKGIDDKKGTK